jgi:hypothetical protein
MRRLPPSALIALAITLIAGAALGLGLIEIGLHKAQHRSAR